VFKNTERKICRL